MSDDAEAGQMAQVALKQSTQAQIRNEARNQIIELATWLYAPNLDTGGKLNIMDQIQNGIERFDSEHFEKLLPPLFDVIHTLANHSEHRRFCELFTATVKRWEECSLDSGREREIFYSIGFNIIRKAQHLCANNNDDPTIQSALDCIKSFTSTNDVFTKGIAAGRDHYLVNEGIKGQKSTAARAAFMGYSRYILDQQNFDGSPPPRHAAMNRRITLLLKNASATFANWDDPS